MSLLEPIQAAIVDLDGTLVDTLGDFEAALWHTLHDLGVDPQPANRAFIGLTVGKGSEYLVRQTLHHVGLDGQDESLFERALALYQTHYGRFNGQHSTVFAGVPLGLEQFRQKGWRLACLTNKPSRYARELLELKGLLDHFDQVFGGDAFERKKPDPLPLLQTCLALGTEPRHTLMIGDSLNDAQAGHAAGCPVVLVSYGYNHGRPIREVPAAAYIDRLDDLLSRPATP